MLANFEQTIRPPTATTFLRMWGLSAGQKDFLSCSYEVKLPEFSDFEEGVVETSLVEEMDVEGSAQQRRIDLDAPNITPSI